MIYPPVGFFPFADTGNGDAWGLYWPIGSETADPIVAYASHDAWAVIPEHGDLQSLGRCHIVRSSDRTLTDQFEHVFAAANEPIPSIGDSCKVAADDHRRLLALDPRSPFRNCAVADLDVTTADFDKAEEGYRFAISVLPEYGAAHFGLANLLRHTRRPEEASIHLRKSLICPFAFTGSFFWADHFLPGSFRKDWPRKALLRLQRTRNPDENLVSDAFFQNAKSMTLSTGVAGSHDLELLLPMIGVYVERQSYLDAVYLWIMIGDRAAIETTSFRERYKLTPRTWGTRLSELLTRAGIRRRASLVDSMLSAMEKPDGLHL
jgi:hypothetical protein